MGRAQSLQPHIQSDGEKAKLKVKGPDGEEKTYEIPILTGKIGSGLMNIGNMGEKHLDIRALYT